MAKFYVIENVSPVARSVSPCHLSREIKFEKMRKYWTGTIGIQCESSVSIKGEIRKLQIYSPRLIFCISMKVRC